MGHCHKHVDQPKAEEILPKLEVPSVLSRVEELIRRYPVPRSALLQVLWLAQETLGWLPQEAIKWADRSETRPDTKQAYARAEAWRPYRGVATHLLWAWYTGVKKGDIVLEPAA